MGKAERTVTVSPASSFAETALMRVGSAAVRPCTRAHSSKAKTPFRSVAVVMTASAPQRRAISRASAFAPPRCPERRGTAKRAHSSTATTAGSAALPVRYGADARTAMPAAPMKTRALLSAKAFPVQSRSETPSPVYETSPPREAQSLCARARPFSVKASQAISRLFMLSPPDSPW